MKRSQLVHGLVQLGDYLQRFLTNTDEAEADGLSAAIRRSEIENPWFTRENQLLALKNWTNLLTGQKLDNWLQDYSFSTQPKRVGLILAGNIPLVGFHDVLCTILAGHFAILKLSSKDRLLIPFLLKKWEDFCAEKLPYSIVEKLEDYDAVIATGSNNTTKYLEYYFKDTMSIIRKNRTSVAVLSGEETDRELQNLGADIFTFYGLGCRNVSRIFIPRDFVLDKIFENFQAFGNVINHNKYANNYDYNRAIYLLNQDKFWDNNFGMLKEDEALFSPLSVVHFSRYGDISEVRTFLHEHRDGIQAVVCSPVLNIENSVDFGTAQQPGLDVYADNVDVMRFLEVI